MRDQNPRRATLAIVAHPRPASPPTPPRPRPERSRIEPPRAPPRASPPRPPRSPVRRDPRSAAAAICRVQKTFASRRRTLRAAREVLAKRLAGAYAGEDQTARGVAPDPGDDAKDAVRGGFVQRSGLATRDAFPAEDTAEDTTEDTVAGAATSGRTRPERGRPGHPRRCFRVCFFLALPVGRVRETAVLRPRRLARARRPQAHASVVMPHDSAARRALSKPLELIARPRLEHLRHLRRE